MDTDLAGRVQERDVVILDGGVGTSVVVHLHGATALSWKCDGKEILFLSKKAVLDNSKAIRGGIPLVFPQFGPWTCGPQHGFARNKRWSVESQPQKADGTVTCSLALSDDEDTRKIWNYRFKLVYTLELTKSSLSTRLTVDNTGSEGFTFTTLMHSYFLTPDIATTTVRGLKGLNYVDKVKNGQELQEDRDKVTIPQNYDRVYQKCPSTVSMECSSHTVSVNLSNFTDVVVWNPWSEKARAMSDFGDEEYSTMVCVEAGRVSCPVQIAAGQQLAFQQTLQVQAKL
ncbi:putative glucose-6-phosphate 1-epimerase [Mizuhopecten yessoensis]|uniref:glucose-6-phosphate 1-epimerase n=1 Tax=Mizuhopecten yessoensis TaxID=6573 RepID=A0A210QI30_MIZYE|nr:putative glucose-6-phosphate 1-epimerase [Mizuhopecten yessoensis]OWF48400.1 glucose-6-phosphate 1-epimerase [Mizuhopecten yessoensis]